MRRSSSTAAWSSSDVPGFNIAVRGLCYFHVTVRTGTRDLHSGMYGGASLNAMHALMQALSAVLPRDGRLPDALRVGVAPPAEAVLAGRRCRRPRRDRRRRLPSGRSSRSRRVLSPHLGRALPRRARHSGRLARAPEDRDPRRVRSEPLDSPGGRSGSRRDRAGARSPAAGGCSGRRRRRAHVALLGAARSVPPDAPAVQLGLDAFEEVLGMRPLLVRSGGAIPLVSALAARGIATVLTGFALNESNIHSPNERIPAAHLPRGIETAAALYPHLARLG